MIRTAFPFVLIITLLIAGCTASSPATPAATPTLPAVAENWTVKMTHSGGIMGLMRTVEVASDGSYIVTDERAKQEISGKLTDSELAKLSAIVTNTKLISSSLPGMSACADCFIYDIEIQGSGKNFTTQLDDISLPGSGAEVLVAFLRGIIDSALK